MGKTNVVADALNRKANLLAILKTQVVSFDSLPNLNKDGPSFDNIWSYLLIILIVMFST